MSRTPSWFGTASIRTLLLAGITLILLTVIGVSAALSFSAGTREAEELFDARLATSARVVESLVARSMETATSEAPLVMALPAPLEDNGEHRDDRTPLGHYYETHIAYQVWRGSAGEGGEPPRLLARSSSAPVSPFSALRPGFSERVIDGRSWRVFALDSDGVWILAAERDDARAELAAGLGWAVTAPLLGGLLLVLAASAVLIQYGLSPLGELAVRIRERAPQAVGPLGLSRVPAEIGPVLSALNLLLERIRRVLERERRFIDTAAHELRTPLSALRVHAQNLERARDEHERGSSLSQLLSGVERTARLADQMLAFSRAGRVEIDAMPVSLREVLADVLRQRELATKMSGHRLVVSLCADACKLHADPVALASMAGNLVDNARHYSPAGTDIQISLLRLDDRALLVVEDAGPGIPPELRARALEPYYRVPGSAGTGSGLGLSIVKEVVDRLEGTIAIEVAESGSGARVRISLPLC